MTLLLPIAAIAFSAVMIVLLGRGDPKRRRATGRHDGEMPVRLRRLLAAAACLPGLACALLGDAAAFMLWLGGAAVLGWFVALGLGQAGQNIG
ncbi:hypothetical protein [Rhizorhabdus dicambivorans]|uniref:DUF3325 domain-containing protein n=1 Tax=Rhizorhabdus dicambivorans TaxID=1850238 RepID=A0A2A4FYF9_9SPHN|nr:hypothetical protein [Rhizorhabdus dicambivorans]ATE66690.1 hypothetical protein CMV14_21600 [Rhizorhabdus dicambivorans]PCE43824.1 hypothetical protein COO09_02545 [Rhizorhabdus dicambivorans]